MTELSGGWLLLGLNRSEEVLLQQLLYQTWHLELRIKIMNLPKPFGWPHLFEKSENMSTYTRTVFTRCVWMGKHHFTSVVIQKALYDMFIFKKCM